MLRAMPMTERTRTNRSHRLVPDAQPAHFLLNKHTREGIEQIPFHSLLLASRQVVIDRLRFRLASIKPTITYAIRRSQSIFSRELGRSQWSHESSKVRRLVERHPGQVRRRERCSSSIKSRTLLSHHLSVPGTLFITQGMPGTVASFVVHSVEDILRAVF